MTVDEFLRWEDGTATRYELVGATVQGSAATLSLSSVPLTIAMADLYEGIPLPEPRPAGQ
jgi:hypothetical protein